MKTKLIIKGVLLYVTILSVLLYMMGIDSIYDKGWFLHGIVIIGFLVILCRKFISREDIEILTLSRYFKCPEDKEVK